MAKACNGFISPLKEMILQKPGKQTKLTKAVVTVQQTPIPRELCSELSFH